MQPDSLQIDQRPRSRAEHLEPHPSTPPTASHPNTGPGAEGGGGCLAFSGKGQQCADVTAVGSLKSSDVLLSQG
jgi:hypothetical protein